MASNTTMTVDQRRARMRAIRKIDTKPEMVVRRIAHRLGYRFRLYRRDLPGTPDLVFPRYRKVVQVHGCFWHQHDCKLGRRPRRNLEYWGPKLRRNVERDAESERCLREMGWAPTVIWECDTKDAALVEQRIQDFLSTDKGKLGSRECP